MKLEFCWKGKGLPGDTEGCGVGLWPDGVGRVLGRWEAEV